MTGIARRGEAVRGHLARLAAVLAVLAGLVLAVGLQCTDGSMAAMPMNAASVSMKCGVPATMEGPAEHWMTNACPAGTAAHVLGTSDFDGLGGVLATCLAFIVAVAAAVVSFRPGGLHGVVRMVRSLRVVAMRAVQPRAPSLAELCLLRT
jgi:hypothetical protein